MLRLSGEVLDYYLSAGYYRMGSDLFTANYLPLESGLYTVHWLRLLVPRVAWGARQRQLWRRNARFAVEIKPLTLTAEHEELYARYYQSVAFDTYATLAELLDGPATVFASHVVEVRDSGGRLIAGGIFDRGHSSLMGIVNFYDPNYRAYSLGKYLLLRKTQYAQATGLAYYYPGYLAYGYPKFDYKLFVCPEATEVLDAPTGQWHPFSWAEVARQSAALQ